MANEQGTYLERKLDVVITKENDYTYVFQKARLKVRNALELQPIKEMDTVLHKKISVTEDEVKIVFSPPSSFLSISDIKNKSEHSKWLLSYQLVKKLNEHKMTRLIPIVCPENIVFDKGYTPYLLHYGVKDSLPPYEIDQEVILQELKATICVITDGSFSYEEYMKFQETLKVKKDVESIMKAATLHEVEEILAKKITDLEKLEKTYVHIPNKKWKTHRFVLLGFILCFIPTLVYTVYSLVFLQPKQEAYVESNRAFLEESYSEVVTLLEKYNPEKMPYIVQYQLAAAYVVNESLTEEQRKNVENTITLQTDEQFLLYWIYIGRGMNEEALEIARTLEDKDLVMFALLKYRDEIKQDSNLSSEDKEQKLDEIQAELDEYMEEIEQEAKIEEEKAKEEEEEAAKQKELTVPDENTNQQAVPGGNTNSTTNKQVTPPADKNATTNQQQNSQSGDKK